MGRRVTVLELVKLLEVTASASAPATAPAPAPGAAEAPAMSPQSVFPLVDETTANLKLVGSVTRRDVYLYLWALFAQVIRRALLSDHPLRPVREQGLV
jgi:hypothetical protein